MQYKLKIKKPYTISYMLHAQNDTAAIIQALEHMYKGDTATIYKGFYFRYAMDYIPFFEQSALITIVKESDTISYKIKGEKNDKTPN